MIKKNALIINSKRSKIHGKDLGFNPFNPAEPIYVNEHVIKDSLILLNKANDFKKQGLIARVWSRDGKIYYREHDGDPSIRVDSEWDLPQAEIEPTVEDKSDKPSAARQIDDNHSNQQQRTRSRTRQLTLDSGLFAAGKRQNKEKPRNTKPKQKF